MAFFYNRESKKRPGIFISIVNRNDQKPILSQKVPNPQPEPEPQGNAVLISPEGIMYANGQVLTVERGSDGGYILAFEDGTGITATVRGGTLEILNPGS